MSVRVTHKYRTTKQRSKVSERDLAAKLNGRVQIASGALRSVFLKADVKTDRFLVDDKLCGAQSFSVTLKFWKKLSNEAWANDKRPLIRINFELGEPVYVMDEVTFLELTRQKDRKDKNR